MVCPPVRRDNPRPCASRLSTYRRNTVLYLSCSMISGVDLASYGVSQAKDLGLGVGLQLFVKRMLNG